jgi:hypothetical protein
LREVRGHDVGDRRGRGIVSQRFEDLPQRLVRLDAVVAQLNVVFDLEALAACEQREHRTREESQPRAKHSRHELTHRNRRVCPF